MSHCVKDYNPITLTTVLMNKVVSRHTEDQQMRGACEEIWGIGGCTQDPNKKSRHQAI